MNARSVPASRNIGSARAEDLLPLRGRARLTVKFMLAAEPHHCVLNMSRLSAGGTGEAEKNARRSFILGYSSVTILP